MLTTTMGTRRARPRVTERAPHVCTSRPSPRRLVSRRVCPRAALSLSFSLSLAACYAAPLSRPVQVLLDAHSVGGESVRVSLAREPDDDARPEVSLETLLAQPLDGSRAVRVALLASPEIQADLETLGVARSELLAASLLPNPELDLELRPGRTTGGDELEAHVIVDLVEIATMPLRRAAAEARLTSAEVRAADAVLRRTYEVRVATIRAQAARARYERLAGIVDTARGAYETARALGDAGNVPALEVLTQRALYEELRLVRAEAETSALEAEEDLVLRLGLHGAAARLHLAALPVEVPDEVLDEARLEPIAIEQSLALSAVRAALEAIARDHDVARADGLLPHVHLGLSASYAEQTAAFGPALSMTLPLLDQGQGRADSIEAELHVLEQRHAQIAVAVRSGVRRARNRVLVSRRRLAFLLETLAPVRAELVEETLRQYNAMSATPFAVLEARRAELGNELSILDAARDYWLARAALDQILAGGDAGLSAPGGE
jgi:cobalt-zinc-cadmium efflux system outer membrane protein